MGKTHRFDPRDTDSSDYSEPMDLGLYTDGDTDTTLEAATLVEVVLGCNRVHVGDVYTLAEGATITEAWVTGIGAKPGEFLALVTVQRGAFQIAARLLSLPESFLAGMLLTDYQQVFEPEVEVINATG